MSTTDVFRWIAWSLLALVVVAGLAGWLFWDRDPSKLGWMVGVPFVGEAAKVGKRATTKVEVMEAERRLKSEG